MAALRPTLNRHTQAAHRRKQELFDLLGRECVLCGEDREERLEFDHKFGRDYDPRKLSFRHRMNRYLKEAKDGLLRVLCRDCNLAERKKLDSGQFVCTNAVVERTEDMPF